jgi:hypothetical protein
MTAVGAVLVRETAPQLAEAPQVPLVRSAFNPGPLLSEAFADGVGLDASAAMLLEASGLSLAALAALDIADALGAADVDDDGTSRTAAGPLLLVSRWHATSLTPSAAAIAVSHIRCT